MSTAADRPRPNSLLETIGHYYMPACPAILVTSSAWRIIWPQDNVLTDIVDYLFIGGFLFGLLCAMKWHRLCEHCGSNIPLNPSADAEKADRMLRATHAFWFNRDRVVAMVVALAVSGVVMRIICFVVFDVPRLQYVWDTVVFSVPLAYLFAALNRHNKLQPWCKYCRRGRGDEETATAPDPSPAESL